MSERINKRVREASTAIGEAMKDGTVDEIIEGIITQLGGIANEFGGADSGLIDGQARSEFTETFENALKYLQHNTVSHDRKEQDWNSMKKNLRGGLLASTEAGMEEPFQRVATTLGRKYGGMSKGRVDTLMETGSIGIDEDMRDVECVSAESTPELLDEIERVIQENGDKDVEGSFSVDVPEEDGEVHSCVILEEVAGERDN